MIIDISCVLETTPAGRSRFLGVTIKTVISSKKKCMVYYSNIDRYWEFFCGKGDIVEIPLSNVMLCSISLRNRE